jgi:alanyl-tRNA synthetase
MNDAIYNRLAILGAQLLEKHGGNRNAVAIELGYLPASIAWLGKSTYGLPLDMIADFARQRGLKMDWSGIEYEAAKEGADIRGEIEEAKQEVRIVA